MPRTGPVYTLPIPPFQPQTPISSTAMNTDLSDIADALTGSLARNGAGGMTAVLPLANAGLNFQNDPDTGVERSSANTMSHRCGGSEVMEVAPTGIDVTGSVRQNGNLLLPIGLGPLPWSGVSAPAGWVLCYGQTLSRATYADLWAFAQVQIAAGNTLYNNGDGTTTFGIADMRGRVPGGNDGMGGTPASRLTSATMNPNGTTLGAVNTAASTETVTLYLPQLPPGIESNNPAPIAITTTLTKRVITTTNPAVASSATGGGNQVTYQTDAAVNPVDQPTATGTLAIGAVPVTSTNTGGAAHPNVQPTIVTNYIIFAGV